MKKTLRIIFILLFFLGITMICTKAQAASASISASKTSCNVGDDVTITASVSGVASTNLSVSISSSKFVEYSEDGNNSSFSKTYKLDTSSAGTKTVTLTGDITDENFNKTAVNTSVTVQISESSSSSSSTSTSTTTSGKSSVATLKNLGIKPNDFSGFSANKTSYSVTVPNDVDEVTVYATKRESAQTVTGTGKISLKEGENNASVKVTAEDGTTTKTYTIKITRQASGETTNTTDETETTTDEETATEEEEVFGLSMLNIDGIKLNPDFSPDIYEYTIELNEDLDKLDITTLAIEENSTIEITGNENLQEGENIITILVTDESGEKTAVYQILVNKNTQLEEEQEKGFLGLTDQQQLYILGGIIILLVIILIIVIIKERKNKKENNYEEYSIPYTTLNENNQGNTHVEEVDEEKETDLDNNSYAKNDSEDIENIEDIEDEILSSRKNKHSKGKRFK